MSNNKLYITEHEPIKDKALIYPLKHVRALTFNINTLLIK